MILSFTLSLIAVLMSAGSVFGLHTLGQALGSLAFWSVSLLKLFRPLGYLVGRGGLVIEVFVVVFPLLVCFRWLRHRCISRMSWSA